MPSNIEQFIPDVGLEALRATIGSSPPSLYTSSLDILGEFVMAGSFSIPLSEGRFCLVENGSDSLPGPIGLDEYTLNARLVDWPEGVGGKYDEEGRREYRPPLPSTVSLRSALAPVTNVQVLSGEKSFPEGTVRYDYAVVFTREDYKRFAFLASSAVSILLDFTDSQAAIEVLLRYGSERVRLT